MFIDMVIGDWEDQIALFIRLLSGYLCFLLSFLHNELFYLSNHKLASSLFE